MTNAACDGVARRMHATRDRSDHILEGLQRHPDVAVGHVSDQVRLELDRIASITLAPSRHGSSRWCAAGLGDEYPHNGVFHTFRYRPFRTVLYRRHAE